MKSSSYPAATPLDNYIQLIPWDENNEAKLLQTDLEYKLQGGKIKGRDVGFVVFYWTQNQEMKAAPPQCLSRVD